MQQFLNVAQNYLMCWENVLGDVRDVSNFCKKNLEMSTFIQGNLVTKIRLDGMD